MKQYRFLMIGAHPDDLELRCGGLAMHLRKKGHCVKFLAMTDGSAGHQTMDQSSLALRRAGEVEAAARVLDVEHKIMPIPDTRLEANLENREMLMREIRAYDPHVILTHRTVDYHPDHRACGQLVMDCAYLVNVPLFCPDVPCPPHAPVILSMWDSFSRPLPFSPDLIVPIDDVVDKKIESCLCHVSQFYEWLPHINGWTQIRDAVTFEEKTCLLRQYLRDGFANEPRIYAEKMPEGVHYAETFEWNEYGAPLDDELRRVMTEPLV